MKRKKKSHMTLIVLLVCWLGGLFAIRQPTIVTDVKNTIRSWINGSYRVVGYNAKSLGAFDLSDDEMFVEKRPTDPVAPASLAKLFTISYANTIVNIEEVVIPSKETLALVKGGSSVAKIKTIPYTIENLYAAMLVPSGNDASYVIADYVGGKLNPNAKNTNERQRAFLNGLEKWLEKEGYRNTKINDPSGYDYEGITTVIDLKKVVVNLLKNGWFRNIVAQSDYTAILPGGSTQNWINTNVFLNQNSGYYNKDVIGIKTGSLNDDYNLIVLYKKHGKEFLICSMGSESDTSRYDDVTYILKTIDESSSLRK